MVHLGDNIYERGQSAYTKNPVRLDEVANGESVTLQEYRDKYRLYLGDPLLREVRRLFAFVTLWDDHEVKNNYEGPEYKIKYPDRIKAAYRAFAEYQPIALPPAFLGEKHSLDLPRFHSFSFGTLATFFALDLRQYRVRSKGILLGDLQKTWLQNALQTTESKWNFCLSSVMMMPLQVPDFLLAKNRRSEIPNTPNLDAWDGFDAERQELFAWVKSKKVKNFVVCSGDVHNFFAGQLPLASSPSPVPVGVEFTGASVTSPNFREIFGTLKSQILQTAGNFSNPHFVYTEIVHHMYTKFTVTSEQLVVELMAAENVNMLGARVFLLKKLTVKSGSTAIES